jgi:transcriptional regulator with XRE-family HTH domain
MNASSESPSYRVAKEIRAELQRQRMTQIELADKLGWPISNLRRRLNGETDITVDELFAVAEVLDRPVFALLPQTVGAR